MLYANFPLCYERMPRFLSHLQRTEELPARCLHRKPTTYSSTIRFFLFFHGVVQEPQDENVD